MCDKGDSTPENLSDVEVKNNVKVSKKVKKKTNNIEETESDSTPKKSDFTPSKSNKQFRGQKRKSKDDSQDFSTPVTKKMRNGKRDSPTAHSNENNADEADNAQRSRLDSETSLLSTTDEETELEDFSVVSLLEDLKDLIYSCGKSESTKEPTPSWLQKHKNSSFNHKMEDKTSKEKLNKRKISTPKKLKNTKNGDEDSVEKKKNQSRLEKNDQGGASEDEMNLTIVEAKKRKPRNSGALNIDEIPEEVMDFIVKSSIDEKLQNIAVKEKLTETHVKNIIKQVITDKSVLAMLKNSVYGISSEDSDLVPVYEPKLTRAKTKELYEKQMKESGEEVHSKAMWGPPPPMNETTSLVTVEFPEEEEDEEYHPEQDEHLLSDEESMLSVSGFGSPASTPSQAPTPRFTPNSTSSSQFSKEKTTPHVASVVKFKTPQGEKPVVQRVLNFSKEEPSLICTRTRSKYPMTDTPLEYLEMAFKPPDITADMYETEVDDEEWRQFLIDFVQPQDTTKAAEDDEQVDPEYNLLADAEEERPSLDELREELRGDKAVRISKKEVSELMEEFLDSFQVDGNEEEEADSATGQNEAFLLDPSGCSTNYSVYCNGMFDPNEHIMLDNNAVIFDPSSNNDLPQPQAEVDPIVVTYMIHEFSKEQIEVLRCQMAQHTQLLTQSVVMVCHNPQFEYIEQGCKNMLEEMLSMGNQNSRGRPSLFYSFNLGAALETVKSYESNKEEVIAFSERHADRREKLYGIRCCSRVYLPQFPPKIKEVLFESAALPYVQFLPQRLFYPTEIRLKKTFTKGEYYLLASAFKEVAPNVKMIQPSRRRNKYFEGKMSKICCTVARTGRVCTSGRSLFTRVRWLLKMNQMEGSFEDNPLVIYIKTGEINYPKAQVDPLPQGVPCQLKDVNPRFLSYKYNLMIRNYKKKKSCPTPPPPKPVVPSHSKLNDKNIVIIQDGASTKIVLPCSYAINPSTVIVKKDSTNGFPSQQISAETPIMNKSTPKPEEPRFPSYTIPPGKPVNTVAPTIVTPALSSVPTSVPFVLPSFPPVPAPKSFISTPPLISNNSSLNIVGTLPPIPIPLPIHVSAAPKFSTAFPTVNVKALRTETMPRVSNSVPITVNSLKKFSIPLPVPSACSPTFSLRKSDESPSPPKLINNTPNTSPVKLSCAWDPSEIPPTPLLHMPLLLESPEKSVIFSSESSSTVIISSAIVNFTSGTLTESHTESFGSKIIGQSLLTSSIQGTSPHAFGSQILSSPDKDVSKLNSTSMLQEFLILPKETWHTLQDNKSRDDTSQISSPFETRHSGIEESEISSREIRDEERSEATQSLLSKAVDNKKSTIVQDKIEFKNGIVFDSSVENLEGTIDTVDNEDIEIIWESDVKGKVGIKEEVDMSSESLKSVVRDNDHQVENQRMNKKEVIHKEGRTEMDEVCGKEAVMEGVRGKIETESEDEEDLNGKTTGAAFEYEDSDTEGYGMDCSEELVQDEAGILEFEIGRSNGADSKRNDGEEHLQDETLGNNDAEQEENLQDQISGNYNTEEEEVAIGKEPMKYSVEEADDKVEHGLDGEVSEEPVKCGDEQEEEFEIDESENEDDSFEMKLVKKVKKALYEEDGSKFYSFLCCIRDFTLPNHQIEVIFRRVSELLEGHPDLQNDFLLLLSPQQAKKLGKYSEFCVLQCARRLMTSKNLEHEKAEALQTLRLALNLPNMTSEEVLYLLNPLLSVYPDILPAIEDTSVDPVDENENCSSSILLDENYLEKCSVSEGERSSDQICNSSSVPEKIQTPEKAVNCHEEIGRESSNSRSPDGMRRLRSHSKRSSTFYSSSPDKTKSQYSSYSGNPGTPRGYHENNGYEGTSYPSNGWQASPSTSKGHQNLKSRQTSPSPSKSLPSSNKLRKSASTTKDSRNSSQNKNSSKKAKPKKPKKRKDKSNGKERRNRNSEVVKKGNDSHSEKIWTEEEDALLISCIKSEGMSYTHLAKRCKRTAREVKARVKLIVGLLNSLS